MIAEAETGLLQAEVLEGYRQARARLSRATTRMMEEIQNKLREAKELANELATIDRCIQKRVPALVPLIHAPELPTGKIAKHPEPARDRKKPFVLPEAKSLAYANMPVSQAVEKYLGECGRERTLEEIACALAGGGANLTKTNQRPLANLKASISYRNARYRPAAFAIRDGHIGLAAWGRKPSSGR